MFKGWGIAFFVIALVGVTFNVHAYSPSFSSPEHFIVSTPTAGARDFYLYTPANVKPQGLIVMLHGCKTNAAEFDQGTEMSKYAAAHHMAVLYPEQSALANYDHCWNWFWGTETPIIVAGVQQIQKRFHLSRANTFLVGMSAGAAQASLLANCHRDLFAKVLLHSGLQFLAATDLTQANDALQKGAFTPSASASIKGLNCNKSLTPIHFLVVHGNSDQRVFPINGVETTDEMLKLNQLIALKNHQPNDYSVNDSTTPASNGKLGYTRLDFKVGTQFVGSFIQIDGLAHEWSGGNPIQPRNNPNGPNVIDLFFQLR